MDLHLITVASDPGMGKSTDLARTFSTGCLVGPPGAFAMAHGLLGVNLPWVWEVRTLREAREALRAIRDDPPAGAWGVGLDDLSLLCRNTAREAEVRFPKEGSGVYDFFNCMTREVERTAEVLTEAMQAVGSPGMVTCHRREPDAKCKGGPFLDGASWKATPYWVKQSGVVLLAMRDDHRATDWKGYYWHDAGHPQWYMKDRTTICGRRTPMSMGEVLRAYGMAVPRPVGLEWMEEWAEVVAGWVGDVGGDPKKLPVVAAELAKHVNGVDPRHVKWVKWDAYARWEIRRNVEAMRAAW